MLVVDDEPAMLRAVVTGLRARGYAVVTATNGQAAIDAVAFDAPDVVVLDLGLPDIDGVDVIAGLRGWTNVPILVLSGRSGSSDKVEALDAGADDYVTKPFGKDELLARIRAVTRRRAEGPAPAAAGGSLRIDRRRHEAWAGDTLLPLTPIEFALLEALLRAGGDLVTHEELLQAGWRGEPDPDPLWIKPHLARLRTKLRGAGAALPTPVRSLGYRLIAPSPAARPPAPTAESG